MFSMRVRMHGITEQCCRILQNERRSASDANIAAATVVKTTNTGQIILNSDQTLS